MSQYRYPNQRGEFKTWHFTSVLTPTSEITPVFTWYARESQYIDNVSGPIAEVRSWIEKLVLSVNKPDGISFISFLFSHTDVATWMSNATAQIPFLDLHFDGYIIIHSIENCHCPASSTQMDSRCNMEQCWRQIVRKRRLQTFLCVQSCV